MSPTLWGRSSYLVCGTMGYAVGLALAVVTGMRAGLGWPGIVVIAACPVVCLYVGLRLSPRRIVFFELALPALIATTGLAAVAGAPWRTAADIVAIGIGSFQAVGRIGCFRVGCCHGRPYRRGVRYGSEHVTAGLDPAWRGVPLFPVQLLDGAVALAAVTFACMIGIGGGHAALTWLGCYATGRFAVELLRGDRRPHWQGLSEAQWTSLLATIVVAVLEPVFSVATIALAVAATILIASRRHGVPKCLWITQSEHLAEIDQLVTQASRYARARVFTTSAHVELSVHPMDNGTLDLITRGPTPEQIAAIASYLSTSWEVVEIVPGARRSVSHLLLRDHSLAS